MAPSTQDFKNKKSKKKTTHSIPEAAVGDTRRPLMSDASETSSAAYSVQPEGSPKSARQQADLAKHHLVDEAEGHSVESNKNKTASSQPNESEAGEEVAQDFTLEFKGSKQIKEKFPETFRVVEKVVENWVHDGSFEDLPLEKPLVNYYVSYGLKQAKKAEKEIVKKIENSPLVEKIGVEIITHAPKVLDALEKGKKFLRAKGLKI